MDLRTLILWTLLSLLFGYLDSMLRRKRREDLLLDELEYRLEVQRTNTSIVISNPVKQDEKSALTGY
jgi:hypothetical protein